MRADKGLRAGGGTDKGGKADRQMRKRVDGGGQWWTGAQTGDQTDEGELDTRTGGRADEWSRVGTLGVRADKSGRGGGRADEGRCYRIDCPKGRTPQLTR